MQVRRDLETRPEAVNLQDEQYIRKTADRMQDVVRCLANWLLAGSFACLYSNCASVQRHLSWLTCSGL